MRLTSMSFKQSVHLASCTSFVRLIQCVYSSLKFQLSLNRQSTSILPHSKYFLPAITLAIFQSLNARHSNNNCVHRLQYYTVRKFQDFQGPSNSDSRTFKHRPCFQVLSRPWIYRRTCQIQYYLAPHECSCKMSSHSAIMIHFVPPPPKNIPNIFDCNLKKDFQIFDNFDANVPERTGHQTTVQFPTSPSVCSCTTWGKQTKRNTR